MWRFPQKAYDSFSHAAIEAILKQAGVDEGLIRVYVREILKLNVVFHLNGISSEVVPLFMGLLQGDPASPFFLLLTDSRSLSWTVGVEKPLVSKSEMSASVCSLGWMTCTSSHLLEKTEDLQKMVRQTCHVPRPVGYSCNLLNVFGLY